jgi:UrcA family protein
MKFLALPALMALAIAAPADASPVETRSIAVSSVGLDLASPAGATAMAARLDSAAVRACGASPFSARDVQADVRRSACYREAMGRALADLRARSPE